MRLAHDAEEIADIVHLRGEFLRETVALFGVCITFQRLEFLEVARLRHDSEREVFDLAVRDHYLRLDLIELVLESGQFLLGCLAAGLRGAELIPCSEHVATAGRWCRGSGSAHLRTVCGHGKWRVCGALSDEAGVGFLKEDDG